MEQVIVSQEEIYKISDKLLKSKNEGFVDETVYKERIENCMKCPALDYGTTCRYNGGLIQIKAKFINSRCPYPYDPKW